MIDQFIQAIAIIMLGMIAFELGEIRGALKDIERTLKDIGKEADDESDV